MNNFVILNIHNDKLINKYTNNPTWKRIYIIPFYSDAYCCFARDREFYFDELVDLFLYGNESDQIGSISLISKYFSKEFREFVCDSNNFIPMNKVKYIINNVVPSFLPLVLPKDKIVEYVFDKKYSSDDWVQILQGLKNNYNIQNTTGQI